MSKLSEATRVIQQFFPYNPLAKCTRAFEKLGEAMGSFDIGIPEELKVYNAGELAEMHLGVLEAESIITPPSPPAADSAA